MSKNATQEKSLLEEMASPKKIPSTFSFFKLKFKVSVGMWRFHNFPLPLFIQPLFKLELWFHFTIIVYLWVWKIHSSRTAFGQHFSRFCFFTTMDILLLGCYTRISCSLIKWNFGRDKITTPFTPSPPLLLDERTGQ